MKKIISLITTTLMLVMIFSTMSFATEMIPIEKITITGVDTPYNTNSQLDTTVKISDNSYSYFVESKWNQGTDDLYTLTVKTRAYRNYIYNENTKATINGHEAEIIEIKEQNRYITFAYTFPKVEVNDAVVLSEIPKEPNAPVAESKPPPTDTDAVLCSFKAIVISNLSGSSSDTSIVLSTSLKA